MRNRRIFCRAGFVAFGLLPLMATLLFAGWRRTQFDADYFEDLLGLSLGCRVSLDAVEFPRPGMLRLSNVTFYDSESEQAVLTCDRIESRRTAGFRKIDVFRCVTFDSAGHRILSSIHDHVLTQPQLLDDEMRVEIDTIRFAEPSNPTQANPTDANPMFNNSTLELRATSSGSEMRARLNPVSTNLPPPNDQATEEGGTADSTVEITIWRDATSPTQTTVLFESPHFEFPAHLIASDHPWRSRLSRDATFTGRIDCHLDDRGWTVDLLGGDLTGLDLSVLTGNDPQSWLTGMANVTLQKLTLRARRIQELICDVRAPYGEVAPDRLRYVVSLWPIPWSDASVPHPPATDSSTTETTSVPPQNDKSHGTPDHDRVRRGLAHQKIKYRDFAVRLCLSPDQVTLQPLDGTDDTILRFESGASVQVPSPVIEATTSVDEVIASVVDASQNRPTPFATPPSQNRKRHQQ